MTCQITVVQFEICLLGIPLLILSIVPLRYKSCTFFFLWTSTVTPLCGSSWLTIAYTWLTDGNKSIIKIWLLLFHNFHLIPSRIVKPFTAGLIHLCLRCSTIALWKGNKRGILIPKNFQFQVINWDWVIVFIRELDFSKQKYILEPLWFSKSLFKIIPDLFSACN